MLWFLLTALLVACASGKQQNALPDELGGIANKIGLDNVDTSKINVEGAEKMLKEKCAKYGGEGAYDAANEAKDTLIECVKDQINITTLQEEMEAAKPTGDLELVFGKYCRKTPTLLQCMKDFTTALEPCLEESEKENKKMVLNITESLANFLCYKDGDRIAMFISEGGLECITDKQEAIQQCANATFGKKVPTDINSIESMPLFVIKEEQCDDLTKLQECVVAELEKCTEPTPANIMESLFKFIRRGTPCNKLTKGKQSPSAKQTSGAFTSISSVLLVAGAVLLKFA